MADEVHTFLVHVEPLRTSMLNNRICDNENSKRYGYNTSLVFLVVWSVVYSTFCRREVYIVAGRLTCHQTFRGMLPSEAGATVFRIRQSVPCASSQKGLDIVVPTWSLLFHSISSLLLPCYFVWRSIFLSSWRHKLFSNTIPGIFSNTTSDLHRLYGVTSASPLTDIRCKPFFRYQRTARCSFSWTSEPTWLLLYQIPRTESPFTVLRLARAKPPKSRWGLPALHFKGLCMVGDENVILGAFLYLVRITNVEKSTKKIMNGSYEIASVHEAALVGA